MSSPCSWSGRLVSHNTPLFFWSGKVVARSGLRMMPTFPPPPLSTLRRVFPQYGWKVGRSDSAFAHVVQVKPAPRMPCPSGRFASARRDQPHCGIAAYSFRFATHAPSERPSTRIRPLPESPSIQPARNALTGPGAPFQLSFGHSPAKESST